MEDSEDIRKRLLTEGVGPHAAFDFEVEFEAATGHTTKEFVNCGTEYGIGDHVEWQGNGFALCATPEGRHLDQILLDPYTGEERMARKPANRKRHTKGHSMALHLFIGFIFGLAVMGGASACLLQANQAFANRAIKAAKAELGVAETDLKGLARDLAILRASHKAGLKITF